MAPGMCRSGGVGSLGKALGAIHLGYVVRVVLLRGLVSPLSVSLLVVLLVLRGGAVAVWGWALVGCPGLVWDVSLGGS